MNKLELRKKYLSLRNNLSGKEVESKSMAIANHSLSLPIWDKATYSLFLSISDKKEVDTRFILNILQGKDKNIVVSKSNFNNYELTHYLLTDDTRLKVNQWGIPEPVEGTEVAVSEIEVVFVPLLAFDKEGNRAGYGKGFYDRFLAKCSPEVLKVGVSFFKAEDYIFPGDKDIPLDYCITPEKIYHFAQDQ